MDNKLLNFDLNKRVKAFDRDQFKRRQQITSAVAEEDKKKKLANALTKNVLKKDKEVELLRKQKVLLARKKRIRELKKTDGITLQTYLKPYPIANDSDKVILPQQVIEELVAQKIVEKNFFTSKNPLTFRLALIKGKDVTGTRREVLGETYSGVDEFTAEEGRIGIPAKTALSLTKSLGVRAMLEDEDLLVRVNFTILPTFPKIFMQLQPKGFGFFSPEKANDENMNLDMKQLLETTFKYHTVMTKNDWIPITVPNGESSSTIILAVREIQPISDTSMALDDSDEEDELLSSDLDDAEVQNSKFASNLEADLKDEEEENSAFVILNTDVEIDILPSEVVSKKLEGEEFMRRLKAYFLLKLKLFQDAYVPRSAIPTSSSTVKFRVRLPNGKTVNQAFDLNSTTLYQVFDWVYFEICQLGKTSFDDLKLNNEQITPQSLQMTYPFYLSFPWVPKGLNLPQVVEDSLEVNNVDFNSTLKQLNFDTQGYSLNAFWKMSKIETSSHVELRKFNADSKENTEENRTLVDGVEFWVASALDQNLENEDSNPMGDFSSEEVTGVVPATEEQIHSTLEELLYFGVPEETASKVSQKFSLQVEELKNMGFASRLAEAADLLLKYNGRLVRVANALVGND